MHNASVAEDIHSPIGSEITGAVVVVEGVAVCMVIACVVPLAVAVLYVWMVVWALVVAWCVDDCVCRYGSVCCCD